MNLPYRAEYSKSNIAKCKFCKNSINQGVLRIATLSQSRRFDGIQANWFHFDCFFKKHKVRSTNEIEHFESLRMSDQDCIKERLSVDIVPNVIGKKRSSTDIKLMEQALKDFLIENAKRSRSVCIGCKQKIFKDQIRVSRKGFDPKVRQSMGLVHQWHHLTCFAELRAELGYFESADKIPGFGELTEDAQATAIENLPAIKQEDLPEPKKTKLEDDTIDQEYREQNKVMFGYRDKLKDLNKKQLAYLLKYNMQRVPVGVEQMFDRLADCMTFGALKRCDGCEWGQLVFNKMSYQCTRYLSKWVRCTNTTKYPERKPFFVPSKLKDEFPFLEKYKYAPRKRVIKDVSPSTIVKKETNDEPDGPKIVRALPALYEMEFVILGQPERGKDVLKKEIQALGGKVVTKISKSVMAVIASEEMVKKMGARMSEAEAEEVHVVPETFIDEARKNTGKIPDLIIEQTICYWGSDPTMRLPPQPSTSGSMPKSSLFSTAVDPDSRLIDVAHVYEDSVKQKWSTVLVNSDVQSNRNSFYKLQLLEADKGGKYWLFRSWGRIGTADGGKKLQEMVTLDEAQKSFLYWHMKKSGNDWQDRDNLAKMPGKVYPIDFDYDTDESTLKKPVQDLMKLIFDIDKMRDLMVEYNLDTEKMSLSKLSQKQINQAFAELCELQGFVEKGATEVQLIEATNRFYTLIPHSFGRNKVQILRSKDVIKEKLDMLSTLIEMEIAYSLMKSSDNERSVDAYYNKLNTDIDVLEKNSPEFQIIADYLENTHAATHSHFDLVLEDVFMVKREEEESRYEPFRKMHNRKLLWHGSRIQNFAGILSQGLRIAPPEAPVTGYMFGKGIYFADMVSKSANYCAANPNNPTVLLLLCEVALGNMLEKKHAEYINKPPTGYHSVKGVGKNQPDPGLVKKIGDAEVPVGKGVPQPGTEDSTLLYNEFIVYDVAQVQIKYLLKVNIKYKY